MKVAIITGASGQDGSYLHELLTEKGYVIKHLVGDIINFANIHRLIVECIPQLNDIAQ